MTHLRNVGNTSGGTIPGVGGGGVVLYSGGGVYGGVDAHESTVFVAQRFHAPVKKIFHVPVISIFANAVWDEAQTDFHELLPSLRPVHLSDN